MSKEATAVELKTYFEMTLSEFMEHWKTLSSEEKMYFKIELGKVLYPDSKEE